MARHATSAGSMASSDRLLLPGRGLRVRVVGVGLVGFVMTDHTARRSVELDVASHVASNAADDGAPAFCATPRTRRIPSADFAGTRSPPERFDPDAFVRDPLCVGLRPPDERLQPLLQVGGRDLSKPWPILPV